MTDDDYDALSQKQLASIKRDMRISLEDAAVRATYKVMAELETEQEPVAWMSKDADIVYTSVQVDGCFQHDHIPLYTVPPQRTWVGLTDDEIDELHGSPMNLEHSGELKWVRMIEAKLKEKNT